MKVFVSEPGQETVVALLEEASVTATSALSYVECRAALARRRREGHLEAGAHDRAVRELEGRWNTLFVLFVDEPLMRDAGQLATAAELRGADAVHLAAAQALTTARGAWRFACWDRRLWDAARSAGFRLVPEERP